MSHNNFPFLAESEESINNCKIAINLLSITYLQCLITLPSAPTTVFAKWPIVERVMPGGNYSRVKPLRSCNEVVLPRSGTFNSIDPNSVEPTCCKMIIPSMQDQNIHIY